MDSPAVPTMSTAGFLSSPNLMMNYMFDCFLASEESQSNEFVIHSLPAIMARNTEDYSEIGRAVRDSLRDMFSAYFEKVVVNVSGEPWQEDTSRWFLTIRVTVMHKDQSYNLERKVTRTEESRFTSTNI